MSGGDFVPAVRSEKPWRLAALSVASLVIAVAGLLFLSRDEPSAQSNQPEMLLTPVIGLDEGCASFARFWLEETPLSLQPEVIEGLTNCRLAADGTWIVPTGPDDPRLAPLPAFTGGEAALVDQVEAGLVAAIADLESSLSSSIIRDMNSIYSAAAQPVTGNIKDRVAISRPRSRYSRVVQAYLIAPGNQLLANYVGWAMERRRSAYDVLSAQCAAEPAAGYLVAPCQGLEDALSVRYPPWVWELRSDVMIQEYLRERVASGQIEEDVALLPDAAEPDSIN